MQILSTLLNNTIYSFIKNIDGLEHLPKTGGYILAANHNNHLDSFILSAAIKAHNRKTVRFLSRKNILLWRIIGQWGADKLSAILIDPANKQESLNKALNALKQGEIIGNYPEGQLNDSHQLLKPKTGTARLALWTGYPVIPVGISEGPGAHRGLNLLKDILFTFKSSTTIKFGKPLIFNKTDNKVIPKKQLEQTSHQIMSAIAPLCGKSY